MAEHLQNINVLNHRIILAFVLKDAAGHAISQWCCRTASVGPLFAVPKVLDGTSAILVFKG
jgi:hypothetical protein